MIVPFTSRLEALRFPYTFRVEPSPLNGLDRPSVLLVSQLRAIDRRRVVGTVGRLEPEHMARLEQELQRLLNLGQQDDS
jgi:mRNA-degrading endonuclease toxin of MazEF toxin-antitoxin module